MFFINQKNLELGVLNTSIAIIRGISIPKKEHSDIATFRKQALEKALSYTPTELEESPILEGYRELYRKLGYSDGKVKPAAQSFIELLWKRKRFPMINSAVDAYNAVVIEALVGIGAHDLDKITPPVSFTIGTGSEKFKPLGSSKFVSVPEGDFFYIDSKGLILAHLAADDCDDAKLSRGTQNILMVIEGNKNTPLEFTRKTIDEACSRIVKYCGGTYEIATLQTQK